MKHSGVAHCYSIAAYLTVCWTLEGIAQSLAYSDFDGLGNSKLAWADMYWKLCFMNFWCCCRMWSLKLCLKIEVSNRQHLFQIDPKITHKVIYLKSKDRVFNLLRQVRVSLLTWLVHKHRADLWCSPYFGASSAVKPLESQLIWQDLLFSHSTWQSGNLVSSPQLLCQLTCASCLDCFGSCWWISGLH